jgi:uncharacterized protein (TIGR00730 family)
MRKKQRCNISSVGIFCGSNTGSKNIYSEKAAALGKLLVQQGITMVYGGGNIGLMGVIADSMVNIGGSVIGVITERLVEVELAHKNLTELRIVQTMSERKNLMIELSDAFIIMPGGYGTLDEFFEVLTLCQLNNIKKPVGVFNISGYFDSLEKMIRHAIDERFIRAEHGELLVMDDDEHKLLGRLALHDPIETKKWLENFKDVRH